MAEARGHPAAPRRCAVLGSPIAHSLSPVLHRAAYEALGLDGWEYTGVECDEARLPGLLAGLDDSWVGLSLTMPLKRAVLPLLDEVSPLAASVRAVNTVLRHAPSAGLPVGGRSRLTGDNTDVPGMASLLADQAYAGEDGVMVLGGGATACAALAALAQRGASGVELRVREASRAQETVEVGTALGVRVEVASLPSGEELADATLVVSTVPAGAGDRLAEVLASATAARTPGLLVDVVYAGWPTPLAAAWAAAGGRVVGGLELLVRQAALQVEVFTGCQAPLEAMRTAGQRALAARS